MLKQMQQCKKHHLCFSIKCYFLVFNMKTAIVRRPLGETALP